MFRTRLLNLILATKINMNKLKIKIIFQYLVERYIRLFFVGRRTSMGMVSSIGVDVRKTGKFRMVRRIRRSSSRI